MNIPDYISPIVGYRVWQWDAAGLKSLNGERWLPSRPLTAGCRASTVGTIVGRAGAMPDAHDVPQANCTCGVYAAKSLDHLRSTGYQQFGIHGEAFLWGTVVEHELGWRAQFAYPRTLFLPPRALPFKLAEIQSRLETLTVYGRDIFILGNSGAIHLWGKNSGINPAGLDCLIEMRKKYYVRHQHVRTLKAGDRVAILGCGIAVVERADEKEIHVLLWNRDMLRIAHRNVVWNQLNMRWETRHRDMFRTKTEVDDKVHAPKLGER